MLPRKVCLGNKKALHQLCSSVIDLFLILYILITLNFRIFLTALLDISAKYRRARMLLLMLSLVSNTEDPPGRNQLSISACMDKRTMHVYTYTYGQFGAHRYKYGHQGICLRKFDLLETPFRMTTGWDLKPKPLCSNAKCQNLYHHAAHDNSFWCYSWCYNCN